MSYAGGSYQGYQSGGVGNKSRRRDYDDLNNASNGNSNGNSNNNRSPYSYGQTSQAQMQTMEILSGREYGNEFERSVGGAGPVMKNRGVIYACLGFLLLIVVLAPHHDNNNNNNNNNNNFKPPKSSSSQQQHNETTTTTTKSPSSASTSEPESKQSTLSPSVPPSPNVKTSPPLSNSTSHSPNFATTCGLPLTVQTNANNFTFLNSSNLCLAELVTEVCGCNNPTIPTRPSYQPERWPATMTQNIKLVNQSLQAAQELDVVFVGDSITEHWNGRDMGDVRDKDHDVSLVFQQLFQKQQHQSQSQIEGLALGIAGDRCQNLLYRLQNGEMPPALQPKVWWLLIGTNDLGADSCNADAITVGNIRIVEEIRRHHPQTPIVINSLLPRGREELLHVNAMWKILQQINHRLECYAHTQPNVTFFNATPIFIYEDSGDDDGYGTEVYINKTLMDANLLHPSGEGAMLWGQAIVQQVLNLTNADGKNRRQ